VGQMSYLQEGRLACDYRKNPAEERADRMEQDSKEVKVFKDGELIATANHVRKVAVPVPRDKQDEESIVWTCFHMPQITLERMNIFRILNGQPLSSLFNDSGVQFGEELIEPVYYIHGLVETFRGNPSITAVVLGKPSQPINIREFVPKLPDIYKRFSALI